MKIWLRFALYFTAGLLFFALFLAFAFPFLLKIVFPDELHSISFVVENEHYYSALLVLVIFVFCLLSGSLLFSLLFVKPVLQIISSIQNLAIDNQTNSYFKTEQNGSKFKLTSILFKEVLSSIQTLANNLRQAEQERVELEQAKRNWIKGISHDLKTPLSYITGYSSLLLTPSHGFTSDEREKYLAEIYCKGIYISELIEDLNLSFYLKDKKALQLNYEVVELVNFIQIIINEIARMPISLSYDFSFMPEETTVFAKIDRKLMYRVLYNLLVNSVEHNPPNTRIRISLARNEKRQVLLSIQDNGTGMDQETIDHCVNMHYSKNNSGHFNKGIGLYIVKNILDAHQADFIIHSQPDAGTQIQIILSAQ